MLLFTGIYLDKETTVISFFIYAQKIDIAPNSINLDIFSVNNPLNYNDDLNKFYLFGPEIGDNRDTFSEIVLIKPKKCSKTKN